MTEIIGMIVHSFANGKQYGCPYYSMVEPTQRLNSTWNVFTYNSYT